MSNRHSRWKSSLAALSLAALLSPAWAAAAQRPLGSGSKGPDVVKAQILLDRAWFSSGEIDGRFSTNLRRAVLAYQRAQGLRATGKVDGATWTALQADAAPPFIDYTVTAQDADGPFARIPKDPMARAQLKSLDYESVQEALAERFHMSQGLLTSLNRGKRFKAGDVVSVANVGDAAAPKGARSVQIDKSERLLMVLDAGDKVVAAFPVSIGGPRDPLPVGKLKIVNEVQNPSFTYDPALLKSASKDHEKVEMKPGPNNPVGTMWLGLSKPHWGIHGTPDPARLGREETNGCVHMTNWDARRLSTLARVGTVVDVRP